MLFLVVYCLSGTSSTDFRQMRPEKFKFNNTENTDQTEARKIPNLFQMKK